jgi:hypothetical protein
LLQRRWLGAALFGPSLYRGEPLAKLVESYVTDALLKAVAAEAAKGRLLLVATTNLDNEQTTIWNLTMIASQGGEPARVLFRDVLIASASIPGAFPPVMMRVEKSGKSFEELHVDGGITASLFVMPAIAGYLPDPLTALRGANLYVIVNGQLDAATQTTRIGTLAIFKRGIDAGLRRGAMADLQIAVALAQRNGMNMKVTDIPGNYPYRGALDLRPSAMKSLFDFAARCGAEGQIWTTPLEVMEESQQARVEQSHLGTQCPASAPTRDPPPIQTLTAQDSASSAAQYGYVGGPQP